MRHDVKQVTKVNTVKKVTPTAKAEAKAKAEAEAKESARVKREANPQYSHLVSKQAKIERKDAKKQLIEAKRLSNELTKESTNKYENEAILKASNTFVNVVCKDEELMKLTIEATRFSKSGNYSPFFFAQTIQRVVKLSRSKLAYSYKDALNLIIVQRLSNAEN